MSVTPPVSQVEICPYVASAAVASASHAATAVRIVVSSKGAAVGKYVVYVGAAVGAKEVGAPPPIVGLYDGCGVGLTVGSGIGDLVGQYEGARRNGADVGP